MIKERIMKKQKLLPLLFTAAFLILSCSSEAPAGNTPDTGDPGEPICNPRAYTDHGDGIVTDEVTGLVWQKDTAPGTYTWREARDYCSKLTLAGYADWRLPTIEELAALADSGIASLGPAIDVMYFPNTMAAHYWSSTPRVLSLLKAWRVDFTDGYVSYDTKPNRYYVRAVRGDISKSNFIENGDGTVTDTRTGLMWEKINNKNTYTWKQAKEYCDTLTLGGYGDWRLPTRNELHTIVNYERLNPAISAGLFPRIRPGSFPGTAPNNYWTSTTSATSDESAWYVHFLYGYVHYLDKMNYCNVRAVRAGQCAP